MKLLEVLGLLSVTTKTEISILDAIDNLEKKVISTHKFVEYEDRYQIFSIISLFFFLVHIVLPTKKLKNA